MKELVDFIHVELKDGRKPNVYDYAAAALVGGMLAIIFGVLAVVIAPIVAAVSLIWELVPPYRKRKDAE